VIIVSERNPEEKPLTRSFWQKALRESLTGKGIEFIELRNLSFSSK
jgi:hypothetical protein